MSSVLTIRAISGLSGDMLLTGLAVLNHTSQEDLLGLVEALHIPHGKGIKIAVEAKSLNHIAGFGLNLVLPEVSPESHHHTHHSDIQNILEKSSLESGAKALAQKAFYILAEAEAAVHGKSVGDVAFHEVGALDSIVDIALCSALFHRLAPARFVCSPLPLADGSITCAHGLLPSPAPAVLKMLKNVTVRGFTGEGETITPTALALLKAFDAQFGPWPAMTVQQTALVYGGKVFAHAPNGAIFALGEKTGGKSHCHAHTASQEHASAHSHGKHDGEHGEHGEHSHAH